MTSSSGVKNRAIATITRDGHCAQLLEGFSAADGEEMFRALLSALSKWYEHQLRVRLGETAAETIDRHPELLFETEQQLLQVPPHPTAARARTTRLPSTRPVPHHHTQPRAETLHIYKPPYHLPSAHLPSIPPYHPASPTGSSAAPLSELAKAKPKPRPIRRGEGSVQRKRERTIPTVQGLAILWFRHHKSPSRPTVHYHHCTCRMQGSRDGAERGTRSGNEAIAAEA